MLRGMRGRHKGSGRLRKTKEAGGDWVLIRPGGGRRGSQRYGFAPVAAGSSGSLDHSLHEPV